MFGDNLIIGHFESKIDDKHRIIIPSFTGIEANESLIIKETNFQDEFALKIYAYNEYFKIIERLKRLRDNTTNREEYFKYTDEIEKICFSLSCSVKSDKQRRVQIPINLFSEINWQKGDMVLFDGLGESLLVRKK